MQTETLWPTFILMIVLWIPLNAYPQATAAGAYGSPMTLETGADNGFLQCVSEVLRPDYRHSATPEAFENLLRQPDSSAIAVIAGHGEPGLICTGTGDSCNENTDVDSSNENNWKGSARSLQGKFRNLLLLGCNIGAEQKGADLLYMMAQDTQMRVVASTGLIWCDRATSSVYPQSGARWQSAGPASKPSPLPRPVYTIAAAKANAIWSFKVSGEFRSVSPDAITVTAFQFIGTGRRGEFRDLDRTRALSLLRLIDLAHPFVTSAIPGGVITAKFAIEFAVGGRTVEKHFVIYNDEIVNDLDDRQVFYRTDTRLSERLHDLSR